MGMCMDGWMDGPGWIGFQQQEEEELSFQGRPYTFFDLGGLKYNDVGAVRACR